MLSSSNLPVLFLPSVLHPLPAIISSIEEMPGTLSVMGTYFWKGSQSHGALIACQGVGIEN